jgi:hypothetical protein
MMGWSDGRDFSFAISVEKAVCKGVGSIYKRVCGDVTNECGYVKESLDCGCNVKGGRGLYNALGPAENEGEEHGGRDLMIGT